MSEPTFMASVAGAYAAQEPTAQPAYAPETDDTSIVVGDPAPSACALDPKNIWVYANTITQSGENNGVVAFDVVFSVGISDDCGSKTYQVVKRIGIDKVRLAEQACQGTPVTVVESKEEPKTKAPTYLDGSRFRSLAGLE